MAGVDLTMLLRRVADLAARLDTVPALRWGTVTATSPLQVLLDYPLAFGALGLSGFFWHRKNGLIIGYVAGTVGRYVCHVLSGYIFFAEYAPEGMNPLAYTLGYNLTYILPEVIATVAILSIPSVMKALGQVKSEA